MTLTSLIDSVGFSGSSSFWIVPTPVSSASVAFVGSASTKLKVSSGSTSTSPFTNTETCLVVSPGSKLTKVVVAA